jgi:3-oxoacyl-[acyl-carrier protein] reductase
MAKQTAVITGAGQGLGRAIALKFAQQDIYVILVGKTESKLQAVKAEIADLGGEASVYHLDVTDDAGVATFAESLADSTVDVLVNCAGDWLIEYMENTTNAQLDHILNVNLRAPYILSRSMIPNLRKSDNASIINIGSITVVQSVPTVGAYTASKVGLSGLTGSLAEELKPDKVRVIMISPGPMDTPMRDDASPGIDKSVLVMPETVADMIYTVVSLPRGITTSDFVLHSMNWE